MRESFPAGFLSPLYSNEVCVCVCLGGVLPRLFPCFLFELLLYVVLSFTVLYIIHSEDVVIIQWLSTFTADALMRVHALVNDDPHDVHTSTWIVFTLDLFISCDAKKRRRIDR